MLSGAVADFNLKVNSCLMRTLGWGIRGPIPPEVSWSRTSRKGRQGRKFTGSIGPPELETYIRTGKPALPR